MNVTNEELDVFIDFKTKYKKNYKSNEEEVKALVNVVLNRRIVLLHNDQHDSGLSTFKMKIWRNSDLSAQDIVNSMTGFRQTRPQSKAFYDTEFPTDVPDHVNYVEEGLVPNVMNQGFCGSCWAFSALGALEGQLAKNTGQLIKLSEQNLIDCNKDEDFGNWACQGGDMVTVYDYIMNVAHGINSAPNYRYTGKEGPKCNYKSEKSAAAIQDFVQIQTGDEYILMLALAKYGPLAIAVDASLGTFHHYGSGVYDDPACSEDMNHAVVLVGYGNDSIGGEFWLVKNSWGTSYGEKGYIRIARNRGNLCGISNEISCPIV